MVVTNTGEKITNVSNVISSEPTVQPIVKVKYETLIIEEGSIQVTQEVIGNSWIVGSATNGLVGTNTGTQGGGQQVVGGSGRTATIVSVESPNNLFVERFIFTNFNDTGNTSGDWGSGSLVMGSGETATSLSVYKGSVSVVNATLTLDNTTNVGVLQLSANGGSNWENVTNATNHSFTYIGSDLRFRLGASGGTATIVSTKVQYNVI